MKSWNVHAWYITGFLLFLLIASWAIQWSAIPDLPGVISFALGLSSLLLALIAIIQSLTGGSEIRAGLSEIRGATDSLKAESEELKSLAGHVSGLGDRVATSSEKLEELIAKNSTEPTSGTTPSTTNEMPVLDAAVLTYGGALAAYAAASSVETGRQFALIEVYGDLEKITPAAFQEGFLTALVKLGYFEADDQVKGGTRITNVRTAPSELKSRLRKMKFGDQQSSYQADLAAIDRYFSTATVN